MKIIISILLAFMGGLAFGAYLSAKDDKNEDCAAFYKFTTVAYIVIIALFLL